MTLLHSRCCLRFFAALFLLVLTAAWAEAQETKRRLLYAATPGIRNYLQYGGHGVLVYDIDHGHQLIKRIPLDGYGVDADGQPINVKGICASAATGRLYVSTIRQLICIDLLTEQVLWQKEYAKGCDRMSISPDGQVIYQPSFEDDRWYVLDAEDGSIRQEIVLNSRAHNTVYGIDGSQVYMAGLASPMLAVADTATHTVVRSIGPFAGAVRPFTVNGRQTLVFANVNELLGFEIGDLRTGKKLHRVEITGFPLGKPDRHGCPSHGIALTPDEREVWVADGFNSTVHIFDATVMPPRQVHSISLREQPGWITFSIDGSLAWASTGEAIDAKTRQIVAVLSDESGGEVHSEKLLEIDFQNGRVVAAGDQFGRGYVTGR